MSDIAIHVKSKQTVPPSAPSPSISSALPESGAISFEFPVLLRGVSETSAEQAKENWQLMRAAAEKLARTVNETYSTAAQESVEYALAMMEMARANTNDALELASALMAAKASSDVIALASSHARQRLDRVVEQNRHLWAAAQKIASAIVEPATEVTAKAAERHEA